VNETACFVRHSAFHRCESYNAHKIMEQSVEDFIRFGRKKSQKSLKRTSESLDD
jgi:hypothetical protein